MTRALMALVREDLDERELAERICRTCVDGLDVDGAAISLLTRTESRTTLAATDPVAQLLEDLQFSLNEGPCLQAARTGIPVLVPNLHESALTHRWPLFADGLNARSSVSALFALPMQWGAVNIGVLDLYRVAPGSLDDEQWYDVATAVDTASLLILGRRTDPLLPGLRTDRNGRPEGAEDLAWLDQMSGYRAEVHQATGMVQVQLGVASSEAVARMRGYAFAHHRLLVDVARDVVERRLVFSHEMP